MSKSQLMSAQAFCRASGLPPYALQSYLDEGLIDVAEVRTDGDWFYAGQIDVAKVVRQLRDLRMPPEAIREALSADAEQATHSIRAYAAAMLGDTRKASLLAAETLRLRTTATRNWTETTTRQITAAMDEVLGATHMDRSSRYVDAIRMASTAGGIQMSYGDKYTFSIRTLPPKYYTLELQTSTSIAISDLRSALDDARRWQRTFIEIASDGLHLRNEDNTTIICQAVPSGTPDHMKILEQMGAESGRIITTKGSVIRAFDHLEEGRVALSGVSGIFKIEEIESSDYAQIEGVYVGPDFEMIVNLSSVYASLTGALCQEVVLDFYLSKSLVAVRSADIGDLTTIVVGVIEAETENRRLPRLQPFG